MKYTTIFIITQNDISTYQFPIFMIVFLFIFHLFITAFSSKPIISTLLLLFGVMVLYITIDSKNYLENRYNNKEYQVVEGVVKNYKAMPRDCKGNEEFSVNGIYFSFSDCANTGGFNTTGKVNMGSKVKIYYIETGKFHDKIILRFDLVQDINHYQ